MFTLVRALVYASLFIAFLLVFVPARIVARSGIAAPPATGAAQIVGGALVLAGGALAIACVVIFGTIGRGTPMPLDPPRRLITRGPYARVRNPMYLGAGTGLAGAALFFASTGILAYAIGFMLLVHLFIVTYEEPALRRAFTTDYDAYCRRVRRWWPFPRTFAHETP